MIDPLVATERIASLSDESVCTLLANNLCPLCIERMDDEHVCGCGFDAGPMVSFYGEERIQAARDMNAALASRLEPGE